MKLALSKGKVALIDAKDYELVSRFKWHAKFSKGNWYACARIEGEIIFMHNLLLGRLAGLEIDHQDQNGLNNQRANLRYATQSENRANVALRKDSTSGFKGVSYSKRVGKWRAYIQKDKQQIHLGFFNIKEEAAKTYNEAAKKAFGEFAWLNPIH